ncbi:hypothetical protein DY037_08105, partial [Apilactobacillus micheneri]|uniref:P27 family phage terminase small subunit n=2 Tax=Apilactobacillus TaxID=2767877 RepID=UPI0015E845E0
SDIKLANEHFEKEGKIVNGKLNPYYRVYNDAFKVTSNLADKLNMTPMARAKHGLKLSNNKDSYDPIKKLMNDNE